MARMKGSLKTGTKVEILSTIKQGMSEGEIYYNTRITSIRNQLVHGFASREDIELPEGKTDLPLQATIRATVMGYQNDDVVKLVFPGDLLTTSNPVFVDVKEIHKVVAK